MDHTKWAEIINTIMIKKLKVIITMNFMNRGVELYFDHCKETFNIKIQVLDLCCMRISKYYVKNQSTITK